MTPFLLPSPSPGTLPPQVCLNDLLVTLSFLRGGLLQLHGLRSPVVTASAALLALSLWNYFTAQKKQG